MRSCTLSRPTQEYLCPDSHKKCVNVQYPVSPVQWDGGVVLSQALTSTDWLTRHREGSAPWPSGSLLPHCLELGAGTGAVGLSLAACHMVASCTITDIPDMLPHLELNVRKNSRSILSGPFRSPSTSSRGAGASQTHPRFKPMNSDMGRPLPLQQKPSPLQQNQQNHAPASSGLHQQPLEQQRSASERPPGQPRFEVARPPLVIVRSLRWGPPGEDIDALCEERLGKEEEVRQRQQRAVAASSESPPATQSPSQPLQSHPGPPWDLIVGSGGWRRLHCLWQRPYLTFFFSSSAPMQT